MGCSQEREILALFISGEYPIGAKFGLKVFGKGFGKEPFFRKVFPEKKAPREGSFCCYALGVGEK
jgi:hypothetical protein